jgi:hypothetical protein
MAVDFPQGPAIGDIYTPSGSATSYRWNGVSWECISNVQPSASTGDVKAGFQTTDHNGWLLLDGRAISTLTDSQQQAAFALGFTTNIPDAESVVMIMRGGTNVLGDIYGSSAKKITPQMLPVHNLPLTSLTISSYDFASATTSGHDPASATTSSAGDHRHLTHGNSGSGVEWDSLGPGADVSVTMNSTIWRAGGAYWDNYLQATGGAHTHTVDLPNHTHTLDLPSHDHDVGGTLPLGGSGADFDVTMKHMHVNMFTYLGT